MRRSLIVLALVAGGSVAAAQGAQGAAQDAAAHEPGHMLRGAIHDSTGQPVVGAWLEVRAVTSGAVSAAAFEGAPFRSVRSDADGRWALSDMTAGTWLLTAVASTEPGAMPLTDDEFQALARPGDSFVIPAGVAITRIIRHFDAGRAARREAMDLGLATGPRPGRPLRGQLVGGFDPEKFGYEVHIEQLGMSFGGGVTTFEVTDGSSASSSSSHDVVTETTTETSAVTGLTTVSEKRTVDGVSDPPEPRFSVVPDRDGYFDFGSLEVSPGDLVLVQSVSLSDGAVPGAPAYANVLAAFEPWKEGIEIPLPDQRGILVNVQAADGSPFIPAVRELMDCDVWSEGGMSGSSLAGPSGSKLALATGSHLARVSTEDFASPLIAFTTGTSDAVEELSFVMQPCPSFTVQLVDAAGAPFRDCRLELGIEATRDFPKPCRVALRCVGGTVTLEHLLPGSYDVEFSSRGMDSFILRLELKPGGAPVVVNKP